MPDDVSPPSSAPANPQAQPPGGGLQFDRAEFKSRPALTCATCQIALEGEYYKIDEKAVCNPCRERVEEYLNRGSGTARFIKALIFGTLAAGVGALIYYAVYAIFNIQMALVSILIGYMVGAAVRVGSEQRGGLTYQLLAVLLTYLAISGAFLTIGIAAAITKAQSKAPPAKNASATTKKPAPPKPATVDSESDDDDVSDSQPKAPPPSAAALLIVLIPLVFTLPFQVATQNIIVALIIVFGMYEAWKINIRAASKIRGPYYTKTAAASAEARPGSV